MHNAELFQYKLMCCTRMPVVRKDRDDLSHFYGLFGCGNKQRCTTTMYTNRIRQKAKKTKNVVLVARFAKKLLF